MENKENEITVVEKVPSVEINTNFSKQMDSVKLQVLNDAKENDQKFVETVKENLKSAAVKHAEIEKAKAEYQKQQVNYESEKLDTKQQENVHQQLEDIWDNKRKKRQFHYDGVKPILQWVGISEPMNLFMLYLLTGILVWFFLLNKLYRGTIGAIISGGDNENRPKFVKGFLWTLLAVFLLACVAALIFLFLKWQNIILI